MSIDIDWETITSGPDGEALAESIRLFIHDKFQQVTLPGFIRSVQVHSFDFGQTCPELEIKDIGDPLPDFYDDETDAGERRENQSHEPDQSTQGDDLLSHDPTSSSRGVETNAASLHDASSRSRVVPPQINTTTSTTTIPTTIRPPFNLIEHQHASPFPRSGTPGIPGGTSNLSYFHLPLGGLSGTQTPLAAVASGTNFPTIDGSGKRTELTHHHHEHPRYAVDPRQYHAGNDSSSSTRRSTAASLIIPVPPAAAIDHDSGGGAGGGAGVPPNVSPHLYSSTQIPDLLDGPSHSNSQPQSPPTAPTKPHTPRSSSSPPPSPSPSSSDLQILTHVKYAGDIRLTLTAEILLDYPMPSFVGIPLKLSITGLTFDGVAVLASIGGTKLHFCFLAPEDAEMIVGRGPGRDADQDLEAEAGGGGGGGAGGRDGGSERDAQSQRRKEERGGGLLEEIRVESEIGRQEGGRQVLKNVGKVERFVLEQVRRIFDDEFVWPSFWTFLV